MVTGGKTELAPFSIGFTMVGVCMISWRSLVYRPAGRRVLSSREKTSRSFALFWTDQKKRDFSLTNSFSV